MIVKMTSSKEAKYLWKEIHKQGRYIEQLEVMVAHLKKDSHPPVFKGTEYLELKQRLEVVEAWIDNIELIDEGVIN